jgi:HEAT repeat protein
MKKIFLSMIVLIVSVSFVMAADAKKEEKKAEKTTAEYIVDLSSDDENLVIAAEDWLGQKAEKSVKDKLLVLLKNDKREKVRIYAAVALGLIGEKSTVDQICEYILEENSADVRYAEVLAVSRIGIENKKSLDNLAAAREKETDPFIKDFVTKMEEKFKGK